MKKFLLVVTLFALTLSLSSFAATKEEMVKFVKDAVAHAKKVGKDQALKDFSNHDFKDFQKGELYIYAYDFNGLCVGHGQKPTLIGKNLIDAKDQKGNLMIKALRDAASKGSGFVDFYWQNPISKNVEKKLGYVEKVDETYWVGSGIYFKE